MKKLFALLFLMILSLNVEAQNFTYVMPRGGTNLPARCAITSKNSSLFYKYGLNSGLYRCSAANTWTLVGAAAAGAGDMLKSENLFGLTNLITARTNLGLGSLATQSGSFSGVSSGTNTGDQDLSGFAVKANNLSDLLNVVTARANLGLAPVASTGSYNDLTSKPTIDTLLPAQTANAGKYLTTNGTAAFWAAITGSTTGANTFTATQTINPAVDTSALIVSGYSLAAAASAVPMIDLAGTWNTTGVPSAFRMNITNTASGAGSLLMNLQVGGVTQFKVDKGGGLTANYLTGINGGNFGGAISVNGFIDGGGFRVNDGNGYAWTNRGKIFAPLDGVFVLQNNAQTDFNRLQFGGTTATFPSIKRDGTGVSIRNGDDTAFTAITAGTLLLNDGTVKTVTYGAIDSGGVGFKVLRIPN